MTLATKEPEAMQLPTDILWELTLPLSDFRAVAYGARDHRDTYRPILWGMELAPHPETGEPVLAATNGWLVFHLTLNADKTLAGNLPEGGVVIPWELFPARGTKGNLVISQFESVRLKASYPDGSMKQAEPVVGRFPDWRGLLPDPELSYEGADFRLSLYTMEPLVKAMKMLEYIGIFKLHRHTETGALTLSTSDRTDFGGVIMPAYGR